VLVVDDNQSFADRLAALLRFFGHEVFICRSGPEALYTALSRRPDVALIELMLPGMDGYQLARVLREHAELEAMVLIAVTGPGYQEHRRRSDEAGYAGQLPKASIHAELEAFLAALG